MDLITIVLQFHAFLMFLKEPTAPEVDATNQQCQETNHQPTVTNQRRCDGNLQHSLIVTHRTVIIQHPHMQLITAVMERHIGDVRIHLFRLDPLVAETFQLIDET